MTKIRFHRSRGRKRLCTSSFSFGKALACKKDVSLRTPGLFNNDSKTVLNRKQIVVFNRGKVELLAACEEVVLSLTSLLCCRQLLILWSGTTQLIWVRTRWPSTWGQYPHSFLHHLPAALFLAYVLGQNHRREPEPSLLELAVQMGRPRNIFGMDRCSLEGSPESL